MDQIQLGDQIIRFDEIRTRAAYQAMPRGDADRCGCLYCLNFAAQRLSAFPNEFVSMLQKIGIDPAKEGEVYELGPEGEIYFAGEIAEGGERNSTLPNFEYWFADAKHLPKPVGDFGDKVAAVEFVTKLSWVLSDSPTS